MARRLRASAEAAPPSPQPHRVEQAPDREAWRLARLYANGDVRRLKVVDSTTVLVLNNAAR